MSKRREIIFAVACAESYLLEVTRQVVGAEHVDCYLPPMDRRGIRERWKETAKQLVRNGKLPKLPCFDGRAWSHFVATVQLRDALLHARTARPYVPNEAPRDDIEVTLADLERQKPGEARDAVKSLISAFAQSGKIDAPCWLISA